MRSAVLIDCGDFSADAAIARDLSLNAVLARPSERLPHGQDRRECDDLGRLSDATELRRRCALARRPSALVVRWGFFSVSSESASAIEAESTVECLLIDAPEGLALSLVIVDGSSANGAGSEADWVWDVTSGRSDDCRGFCFVKTAGIGSGLARESFRVLEPEVLRRKL
jgi:hypothetical protein